MSKEIRIPIVYTESQADALTRIFMLVYKEDTCLTRLPPFQAIKDEIIFNNLDEPTADPGNIIITVWLRLVENQKEGVNYYV